MSQATNLQQERLRRPATTPASRQVSVSSSYFLPRTSLKWGPVRAESNLWPLNWQRTSSVAVRGDLWFSVDFLGKMQTVPASLSRSVWTGFNGARHGPNFAKLGS